MSLLFFYFSTAILASFLCSLLEAVILSVTPAFVAVSTKNKIKGAAVLGYLKNNMDQSLAAILTVNTIANTVGATGVGAQALKVYGDTSVAIVTGALTFSILIFSEIIPKTLGARHWKHLAIKCGLIIRTLIFLTYPLVALSMFISKLLSSRDGTKLTREEMIQTAIIGATQGAIRQKESRVIHNLLMLDRISVRDILTPRSVVTAFCSSDTVGHTLEKFHEVSFSRIPLYSGDLDNVVGLLLRHKLIKASSDDLQDLKLNDIKVDIHTVHHDTSVSSVLDIFIKRKEHLFLVIDDYKTTLGIVTLEDAIETLLGVEIIDETDTVEDMRILAMERWKSSKRKKTQKE